MHLWVNTVVWGEEYVGNFLRYALPSFLSPGNLPELTKHVDATYQIITLEENHHYFHDSWAYARLTEIMPVSLATFTPIQLPPREIEYQLKKPIVETIHGRRDANMFLAPDMIWADGSLGHAGKALAAGKVAMMLPNFKVTTQTLLTELYHRLNGEPLVVPFAEAYALFHRHMHPIVGSMHCFGPRAPAHHDYLGWPVGNEGMLFYYLVRGPDCYVPHSADLTAFWSVGPGIDKGSVEVAPSNKAFGLSTTPIAHMMNFLHAGQPHSAMMHGQFMYRHQASMIGLLEPTLIPLVDKATATLWNREIDRGKEYASHVLRCRNDVMSGKISAEPTPYLPASYANALSLSDIRVSEEVLQWVETVIDGRFPQETLRYLRGLRDLRTVKTVGTE
jgi:hypothetical protein